MLFKFRLTLFVLVDRHYCSRAFGNSGGSSVSAETLFIFGKLLFGFFLRFNDVSFCRLFKHILAYLLDIRLCLGCAFGKYYLVIVGIIVFVFLFLFSLSSFRTDRGELGDLRGHGKRRLLNRLRLAYGCIRIIGDRDLHRGIKSWNDPCFFFLFLFLGKLFIFEYNIFVRLFKQ